MFWFSNFFFFFPLVFLSVTSLRRSVSCARGWPWRFRWAAAVVPLLTISTTGSRSARFDHQPISLRFSHTLVPKRKKITRGKREKERGCETGIGKFWNNVDQLDRVSKICRLRKRRERETMLKCWWHVCRVPTADFRDYWLLRCSLKCRDCKRIGLAFSVASNVFGYLGKGLSKVAVCPNGSRSFW